MRTGAKALLDRADGTFGFADVTVGRDNVHRHGEEGRSRTLKLVVAVYVANREATGGVDIDIRLEQFNYGPTRAVSDRMGRTVADIAGDGVEETQPLNEKEIDAQGDVGVMCEDGGGNRCGNESGGARRRSGPSGLAFLRRNFRPVYDVRTLCIINGDRAVMQKVAGENLLEENVARAAELTIQCTGGVRCIDFPPGEQLLLLCYCGNHSVGGNGVVSTTLKHVKTGRVLLERHYRAVKSMNVDRRSLQRIHRNAAYLPDVGKGKDVGNGGIVEPHLPEVGKVTDHVRILVATVRDGAEHVVTLAYVSQHLSVLENRDRRLGIQQNPVWVKPMFAVSTGLREHVSILRQREAGGGGGVGCGSGGAELLHVTILAAIETRDTAEGDAVGTGHRRGTSTALHKCHSAPFDAHCSRWCFAGWTLGLMVAGVHRGLVVNQHGLSCQYVGRVLVASHRIGVCQTCD